MHVCLKHNNKVVASSSYTCTELGSNHFEITGTLPGFIMMDAIEKLVVTINGVPARQVISSDTKQNIGGGSLETVYRIEILV